MKREDLGNLAPAESELLARDSSVRERLERDRDQAGEYMRFEYEQLGIAVADPMRTIEQLMIATHSYAQAIARYTLCRKSLALCGWDEGDYPDWYSKVMEAAVRGGH